MSNHIERELGNSGKEGEAQKVSEQTLGLEEVTRENKKNLVSPEYLTQFMRNFWVEAGQRVGKNIVVDNFPLTAKEIKEKAKGGQMAIFVPDGLTREDLGKMFPKMKSWATQEENLVVDEVNNSGWLWIEASVDAPNRNTTQGQLEEKFRKEGKQGQSLRTYIIGSQISKLLTDHYFDEGPIWLRLLGSCFEDGVLYSSFNLGGGLHVCSVWVPEYHAEYMGGRSEEVIRP